MEPGQGVNYAALHPTAPNKPLAKNADEGFRRQGKTNAVALPGDEEAEVGGPGSPKNLGTTLVFLVALIPLNLWIQKNQFLLPMVLVVHGKP